MQPYLDDAGKLRDEIIQHKETLRTLKRTDKTSSKIQALQETIQTKEKARRTAENKAEAISNAVYDLKAVNPNKIEKIDDRTPAQVIKSIEEQGKIVADALGRLNKLLKQPR